ncbi:transcription antitermination factor NusB [Neiella marina]|uniref:Transcription antitermination protein NusB n=1 Tax=Neiella holothuriorum TaxID=2870530 RepID=A0ABS7EHJ0_9GAMM|nr:transcription antitermination factor NusB [Neiella holothuriorum]MBW8191809.1 transcription antitermination factor NusB [Neiella holothuriorum]
MNPKARRKARELAVQAIYSWQLSGDPMAEVEVHFMTDQDMDGADIDYFREVLSGVASQIKSLDARLSALTSRPLDDVDQIDKAILRLAAYEFSARQTPYKVVINEAIELAKVFASDDSHKFVNGVLDQMAPRA